MGTSYPHLSAHPTRKPQITTQAAFILHWRLRKHTRPVSVTGVHHDPSAGHLDPYHWAPSYQRPMRLGFACSSCSKQYSALHHAQSHERVCTQNKRSIASILDDSRAFWEARKKRRIEESSQHADQAIPGAPMLQFVHGSTSAPSPTGSTPGRSEPGSETTTADVELEPASGATRPHDSSTSSLASATEAEPADLDIPIAQRKPTRERRLPKRYRDDDVLPAAPSQPNAEEARHLAQADQRPPSKQSPAQARPGSVAHAELSRQPNLPLVQYQSTRSPFGVMKTYNMPHGTRMTHDPDRILTLEDLSDISEGQRKSDGPLYGPFKSKSAFSLADWYWNSTTKSFADFQKLLAIFKEPGFSMDDALNVNWRSAFKVLGSNRSDLDDSDNGAWITDDGWVSTPVNIEVPFHKQMKKNKGTADTHCIGHFRHRRIMSVIREKLSCREDSRYFHYYPHRATWKPTEDSAEVELYGELYASKAFRDAHDEIQRLPETESNRGLERVVVALMIWSDGTQLTQFGSASLWPCYLFFGNESKYRRCRPSEGLANHIAYFLKLPDTFHDYLKERNGGKMPTEALVTYCSREAFHQQWRILLDEELLDAMRRGFRLTCPDGRMRCFYPRIFTYSADYLEKVLIACLRNNGLYPCHRCLVGKDGLSKLGAPSDVERASPRKEADIITLVDQAQVLIKDNGYAVDSKDTVEVILKPQSLVPNRNAFSNFSGHTFDIRDALVVDLMHEFEIGVWKKVYIHGIRLLEASSNATTTLTAELDWRFRETPPFGREGVRKFCVNASDMKRKAARDFEDLLQCAFPAFESLLPEPHNTNLLRLLYICAQWHALAKLRLHNDFTVDLLEYTTTLLGSQMRRFYKETCREVHTEELEKEAEARERREGKGKGKGKASSSRKTASLGVFTIKFHFLGDYVACIRRFGTSDSFSTETGELSHRLPKSWYPRTDKRNFEKQMSAIERRQARLSGIRSDIASAELPMAPIPAGDEETGASLDSRYTVAANQNEAIDLSWLRSCPGYTDRYISDFVPKLKRHLLPRIVEILGYAPNSVPESEFYNVVLAGDRIYVHRLLRVYYTTYDVRRAEDVIHVDTPQCNVMVLNGEYRKETWDSEHPYLYGKCLGVYHANVSFVGFLPDGTRSYAERRIDFVWVHWYKHIPATTEFSLERLSLLPLDDPTALGFIHPADILRGVHVIPRFSLGKRVSHQESRWVGVKVQTDTWKEYYINRFADRDLFMRYQYGMSVGHTYMHSYFPPPQVPHIPPDFDYHMLSEEDAVLDQVEGDERDRLEDLEDRDLSDVSLPANSDLALERHPGHAPRGVCAHPLAAVDGADIGKASKGTSSTLTVVPLRTIRTSDHLNRRSGLQVNSYTLCNVTSPEVQIGVGSVFNPTMPNPRQQQTLGAPVLRPVPLPGGASDQYDEDRPVQLTSEDLRHFVGLGLLPRPTTAPTVPSPLRHEWTIGSNANLNPARAQTSAGGKLVYFDYKEETELLNQHGTRYSAEELETCGRLLQDGLQIHIALLTHVQAGEFFDAVRNKDRVSVHPVNDYASIVKWAPSVIEYEALRPFLHVIDHRSAQDEEPEGMASSPPEPHSPAVSSCTLNEALTTRDERHHPATEAPIHPCNEPEQGRFPIREYDQGLGVPATHSRDPRPAQPTPNIGTLQEPEALPVREFGPLPERHPARVAEPIPAEISDRMPEALPEATDRAMHPLLVVVSATVGGLSMWACLAFGPFDIAFTSPLVTFPVKLFFALIMFRIGIRIGRRLALGLSVTARYICFFIMRLTLRAFQFVLESMLATLVRIQGNAPPSSCSE
ncbi:hypothetical protein NMY22_g8891 [Coprinellus aureogranulatus]|nr:hypothetical protein NMY22_g8891 [Coprinellus aureogranulatus]